jgi:cyclohexanecarboxylate-CoA ligase
MRAADMLTPQGGVGGLIAATAAQHPDTAVRVHSDSNPLDTTLGELFDDGRRIAASLSARGIGPGDVVAVQLPNWRECFLAHTAVWLCGAVLLPIVPIYGPREVAFILRQSNARALIIASRLGRRDTAATLAATDELPGLRLRVVVGDAVAPGCVPFSELMLSSTTDFVAAPVRPDDRCLIVYTSGTTAEPKGVQHTHASLIAELDIADQLRGAPPGAPSLAMFTSGHIAGVLGIVKMLTRSNMTLALDPWNPELAARLIATHRVGASGGAPIHLSAVLDVAEREGLDLSSLCDFTTGAAGVAGALIRRADTMGVGAFRSYGSTEHPTVSWGSCSYPLDKRADTDGRLSPGTEVRLVDDHGRDVARGCQGEILTRGPELFVGYTDPRHTASAMVDGWFRTGDIGRLDDEGYLTITDRKKDIIVRGGENISSKEVEDVLASHPAVAEVAAIGFPDDKYGERVGVVVVIHPGQHFDLAEAATHFEQCGLARQKTPERILVVDELPRTASGKVQKHLLRNQLID